MNTTEIWCRIGEIGEDIVARVIPGATRSSDWYDSKKDGMIHNKYSYEVKTKTKHYLDNGFYERENQQRKILNADHLFILEIGEHDGDKHRLHTVINHKEVCKTLCKPRWAKTAQMFIPAEACLSHMSFEHKELFELAEKVRSFKR